MCALVARRSGGTPPPPHVERPRERTSAGGAAASAAAAAISAGVARVTTVLSSKTREPSSAVEGTVAAARLVYQKALPSMRVTEPDIFTEARQLLKKALLPIAAMDEESVADLKALQP